MGSSPVLCDVQPGSVCWHHKKTPGEAMTSTLLSGAFCDLEALTPLPWRWWSAISKVLSRESVQYPTEGNSRKLPTGTFSLSVSPKRAFAAVPTILGAQHGHTRDLSLTDLEAGKLRVLANSMSPSFLVPRPQKKQAALWSALILFKRTPSCWFNHVHPEVT